MAVLSIAPLAETQAEENFDAKAVRLVARSTEIIDGFDPAAVCQQITIQPNSDLDDVAQDEDQLEAMCLGAALGTEGVVRVLNKRRNEGDLSDAEYVFAIEQLCMFSKDFFVPFPGEEEFESLSRQINGELLGGNKDFFAKSLRSKLESAVKALDELRDEVAGIHRSRCRAEFFREIGSSDLLTMITDWEGAYLLLVKTGRVEMRSRQKGDSSVG